MPRAWISPLYLWENQPIWIKRNESVYHIYIVTKLNDFPIFIDKLYLSHTSNYQCHTL